MPNGQRPHDVAYFQWRGKEFTDVVRKNTERLLRRSAVVLQREMKTTLSHPGHGIHHPGASYRSSAEGDPPTVQTGHLRRSIQIDLGTARFHSRNPHIAVGTRVDYGFFLEYGTIHMLPRPWLRRSMIAANPKIQKLFTFKSLTRGYNPKPGNRFRWNR